MGKRIFSISELEANALLAAYHATNDGAYRTRLQAVRLYGIGYTAAKVGEITGSPRSTLLDWCHTYQNGGITALQDGRVGGNSRKLTPHQVQQIGRTLRLYTPRSRFGPQAATPDGLAWTVADLKRLIEDEYNVVYQSSVSYYTVFARVGYSYHQPSASYRSRNQAAVIEWETQLEKN
jgi:transposase